MTPKSFSFGPKPPTALMVVQQRLNQAFLMLPAKTWSYRRDRDGDFRPLSNRLIENYERDR